MQTISNQKTTLHEVTASGQLVTGSAGVVVAIEAVSGSTVPTLDLHDGTSSGDPKIASKVFSVANDVTVFPPGFRPEFGSNGLRAEVSGTSPVFKVYTA
jgi:hypothetical protein